MKAYCLKRGKHLLPNYVDFDRKRVKDQVGAHFGMTFKELRKSNPKYSIVKVELLEMK